jgi:spermidine dehydrogenase
MLRRDYLNGMAFAAGAARTSWGWTAAPAAYPPSLTGLRGSHPGSMDIAHAKAWADSPQPLKPETTESFDLIVVGAGISGLASAFFYAQQVRQGARILVLDNHDDFGGHARRNEFEVDGHRLLTYGGTQSLDTPARYSKVTLGLLRQLGIDLVALRRAYDLDYFKRHGLGMGLFYDAATFGRDAFLPSAPPTLLHPGYYTRHYVPGIGTPKTFAQHMASAPLTIQQRAQLESVLKGQAAIRNLRKEMRAQPTMPYVRVLRELYGVTDPAVLMLLSMVMAEDSALGASTVSWEAAGEAGLWGTQGQRAPHPPAPIPRPVNGDDSDLDGYFFHFPDGGATLARALVQRMVPAVVRTGAPAYPVDARFDYAALDRPHQPVRIRLGSTAVQVANVGQGTRVLYQRQGHTHAALAAHTIMAGWSMSHAHVVQGLDSEQKGAMRANVKLPMVYAQVVLRRWHAVQRAGLAVAYAPGAYFQYCQMDFPVSMGGYRPPRGPNDPAVLLMVRVPAPLLDAESPEQQIRAGRAELLATDFSQYEEQVLRQLQAMYGPYGLNSREDVAALTINRWGHGFVWDEALYNGEPAHLLASRPVGHIHMAGADSKGRAYLDAAIDAAWHAVHAVNRSR